MPSNIANNANIQRTLIFNCLTHSRDGDETEILFSHTIWEIHKNNIDSLLSLRSARMWKIAGVCLKTYSGPSKFWNWLWIRRYGGTDDNLWIKLCVFLPGKGLEEIWLRRLFLHQITLSCAPLPTSSPKHPLEIQTLKTLHFSFFEIQVKVTFSKSNYWRLYALWDKSHKARYF